MAIQGSLDQEDISTVLWAGLWVSKTGKEVPFQFLADWKANVMPGEAEVISKALKKGYRTEILLNQDNSTGKLIFRLCNIYREKIQLLV